MSDVKRYWTEPGSTLYFEKPPDKPFIPRRCESFTSSEVVLAADHTRAVEALEARLTDALEQLDQIDYICSAAGVDEERIISRQGEPDLDNIPVVERVKLLREQLHHAQAAVWREALRLTKEMAELNRHKGSYEIAVGLFAMCEEFEARAAAEQVTTPPAQEGER